MPNAIGIDRSLMDFELTSKDRNYLLQLVNFPQYQNTFS